VGHLGPSPSAGDVGKLAAPAGCSRTPSGEVTLGIALLTSPPLADPLLHAQARTCLLCSCWRRKKGNQVSTTLLLDDERGIFVELHPSATSGGGSPTAGAGLHRLCSKQRVLPGAACSRGPPSGDAGWRVGLVETRWTAPADAGPQPTPQNIIPGWARGTAVNRWPPRPARSPPGNWAVALVLVRAAARPRSAARGWPR